MKHTDNTAANETMEPSVEAAAQEQVANETNGSENEATQTGADHQQDDVLAKKDSELAEMKDKYLRLVAEFDNYRRRTAQERLEERQTAGRELIVSLLDVLDDMDRAETGMQGDQDADTLKAGVRLVFQKLRSILETKGLKAMEAVQQDFDTDRHEAIAEIPAPDESLKGKVIDQVQKGYLLNDKLIRFAKVVVGN